MKRIFILVLAVSALCFTGCDYVRILAGRPTGAQLEEMAEKQKKEAEEARLQARKDSLEQAQKAFEAREAFLLDSLSGASRRILIGSKSLTGQSLDSEYLIIVGSFGKPSNCEAKVKKCNDAGFPAVAVPFRSGLNAVGICPSESLDETLKNLRKAQEAGICPPDGWILRREND